MAEAPPRPPPDTGANPASTAQSPLARLQLRWLDLMAHFNGTQNFLIEVGVVPFSHAQQLTFRRVTVFSRTCLIALSSTGPTAVSSFTWATCWNASLINCVIVMPHSP